MKNALWRIQFNILKWFLGILESGSERIRIKLGFIEPARRSENVITARAYAPRRVPYGGPRTFTRRKFTQPVTFTSDDESE